jgi:hypothetical protein
MLAQPLIGIELDIMKWPVQLRMIGDTAPSCCCADWHVCHVSCRENGAASKGFGFSVFPVFNIPGFDSPVLSTPFPWEELSWL